MKKRFLSFVAVFFCFFAICGCGKKDKIFIAGTPENIAWAVEIYENVLKTMPQKSYIIKTDGSSKVNTAGVDINLKISGKTMHTPNEVYFENISNGDPMLGINTSFGRRVYYNAATPNQSKYRFSATQGKKPVENGDVVISEEQWGVAKELSYSEYNEKFGKPINGISNYVISKNTILSKSAGVTSHDAEKYTFQFVLDVSNGISSLGVAGYAKQIYTMSEKKCVGFEYVSVTFTVTTDYQIVQCHVEESYKVDAGLLKPSTVNDINYMFNYDENLQVKTF